MTAYYNEIDPKAAATLRELIRQGVIAPGEVDERSINDVRPADLKGFVQCHFFAGAGVWSYAARLANWSDSRPMWSGSCPCQPFSSAGKGAGFDDERHLWPAWFHLIEHAKPRDVPVFGEQVASPEGLAWLDLIHADMEGEKHTLRAFDLCAAGFGAPHIRQRLYFVADSDDVGCGSGQAPSGYETWTGTRGDRGGGIDELAYTARSGGGTRFRDSGSTDVGWPQSSNGCANGDVGNTESGGRRERGNETFTRKGGHADCAGHSSGRLADSERAGLEGYGRDGHTGNEPGRIGTRQDGSTSSKSAIGELADSKLQSGRAEHGKESGERGISEPDYNSKPRSIGEDCWPGPVNGHWRDADWLLCRDGKWRPVESGTFPLAHGSPERVGRLRLYGNAIVAQVAAAFIKVYDGVMP